ncbi:mitochondrial amidoxime-reducing component 1 [Chanos chanos]|uniref:Mitochondrial amidoxime-reducing component 1 n=1 Tax=Chanos chanos TaxID=29144 RepID=A0A6J2WBF0_CHACN|nr:mitochondrial amidoxime-reducing component 1-like [Chanos chanos]
MEIKEILTKVFDTNKKVVIYVSAASLALLGLGLGYKYLRKPKLTPVGVISQLIIHPLKSGKGVLVDAAECQLMGLKCGELSDRHWLIIYEDGQMVTARQQPRLVLVSLKCEGGQLCLDGPDMETLRVPLPKSNNAVYNCRVFSEDTQGRDCGEEVSRWLTQYLQTDKPVRLVHYEPQLKTVRSCQREPLFPRDVKVAYPDAAPIMLLSEASVRDLNSRLQNDVTVSRFRPSIVVDDCEPFKEDTWDNIQIGQVQLKRIMGCGRCVFTTVDPETGIISRKEPLDTLKTYRQCDPAQKNIYKSAPIFGQYYIVKKTGILHVGDPVYKISY